MSDKPDLAVELGDLSFNKQGGKFFPLRSACGRAPEWTSAEWLKILWHPSGFKDPSARRVSLCLETDEGTRAHFRSVEERLVRSLGGSGAEGYQAFR